MPTTKEEAAKVHPKLEETKSLDFTAVPVKVESEEQNESTELFPVEIKLDKSEKFKVTKAEPFQVLEPDSDSEIILSDLGLELLFDESNMAVAQAAAPTDVSMSISAFRGAAIRTHRNGCVYSKRG